MKILHMKKSKNGWETVSSKIVHQNPWYKIQKDDVVLPNGNSGEYFIVKNNTTSSSFIVPVQNGKIIFIKQYRYVFDAWFLELPGGAVEIGETSKITAMKELREEVGYISNDIKEIGNFIPFSGIMDEMSYVFVAKELEFVGQKLEVSESGAEIIEIDIVMAYEMIENGEINDGQTITSLILAKKHLLIDK